MPIAFKCTCGKAYKVPDSAAGKKMNCKECGSAVQVPAGNRQQAKKKDAPEDDPFSMDFGIDDDPVQTDLPPRRKKEGDRPKSKKKKSGPGKQEPNKGLIIGIAVAVLLVVGIGGFFAVQSMNGNGGGGGAAPAPVAINYETFEHELGGFKVKHPSDWEKKSSGGTGGMPPVASFEDGTAHISIRHNQKGAAIGDTASIPQGGPIIPGEEVEKDPPAKTVHAFMANQYALDFKNFEELPGQEFVVPYGDGWLSEFTGSEGFGGKKKAYRLTLVGTKFQYNVICKCPEGKWDKYEPIFMEVIKSISR